MTRWLVDDWRQSLHWFSVHFHALSTLVIGMLVLVPTMPDEVQSAVPLKWRGLGIAAWLLLGYAARVVKQK